MRVALSLTAATVVAATGPCDIFNLAGTPCVAAHSLVRALMDSYAGPLYQVRRLADNSTLDIGLLAPGGFANAAAQDTFCKGQACVVQRIYDQSAFRELGGLPFHGPPSNCAHTQTRARREPPGHRAAGRQRAPRGPARERHAPPHHDRRPCGVRRLL